jgi:hypothetical protein
MTASDEDESARLDPTLPTVEKAQPEERKSIHPVFFILSVEILGSCEADRLQIDSSLTPVDIAPG